MARTASAVWNGDLKTGNGKISSTSGVLADTPYTFRDRFEDGAGTNPEELIAAAHAACFTMATSAALGKAGHTPESLHTTASVTLEPVDGAQTVTKIHLDLEGTVPGIDAETFEKIAGDAKVNCPISRLLKAEITLSTRFNG